MNNEMNQECKQGLISCVVVTYKQQSEYLYETLKSILEQDYTSVEIIVADDGTPDFDSNSIYNFVERNAKKNLYKVVILHNSKNEGTVKNLNMGLKSCTGELVYCFELFQ